MVPQVKCSILVRGRKNSCEKFRKKLYANTDSIIRETNHYRMICTTYFPCDEMLDFTFEYLASKFSVDLAYIFSEFDDQLCEYNLDYNLDEFLRFNGLSETGSEYGFPKETSVTHDLEILRDYLNTPKKPVDFVSGEISWGQAFEALTEYDNQLIREGKFMDQVSVTGLEAAEAGFPRVRLAAESGDEHAKTLLENFAKAPI